MNNKLIWLHNTICNCLQINLIDFPPTFYLIKQAQNDIKIRSLEHKIQL